MSRERRFEQKQNAKIKRLKRIWIDLSPWDRAGGYWNYYGEWTPDDRNRLGEHWRKYNQPVNYCSVPGWWNRLYHTQPKRIAANLLCKHIVKGRDPDSVLWPAKKRPTHYYW
jgi:hypothetical protein